MGRKEEFITYFQNGCKKEFKIEHFIQKENTMENVSYLYLITDNTTNFKLPLPKKYAGRIEIWNQVDKDHRNINRPIWIRRRISTALFIYDFL